MRQSKFTETQIVSILNEADAGRPVNEIWRTYGISSATYYKWKAKYGGLEASDIKRLKELEHEHGRLKRMYADLSLENAALKEVIATKLYGLLSGGEVVAPLVRQGHLPVQRACRAVGLGQATYYRSLVDWAQRDAPVMAALTTLVAAKSRWGFWKCCDRLQLDGHPWNHKRLWRVYCQLQLNLPRRTKQRLPVRFRQPLVVIPQPNVVWAMDFMSDTLYGGRRFRTVNILDEGVREGFAIEVDTSLPAERVVRVLEHVVVWRGQPQAIRLDNGPEFLAERFITWCVERAIELRDIQPGKPDQNAFIERYNRTYRTEVLNAYVFESLEPVREITAEWLQSYNEERPHDALVGVPPATDRANLEARSSLLGVSP